MNVQLLVVTAPSEDVTVGVPQASVAVAVPRAALISEATGLHASVNVVPPVAITGGVTSLVQFMVLAAVAELPQASLAVKVLVCVSTQPLVDIDPSLVVTVGTPHASVAVAVPSAAFISEATGLHPNARVVPPVVSVGGVLSIIHVTVLAAVDELPHASTAVNVLV